MIEHHRVRKISLLQAASSGLSLILLVLVAGPAGTADAPIPAPLHPAVLTLDLAECLRLAHERQPRIAAQRASLEAAENSQQALASLHVPAALDPEIPIRRKQAALGVSAAAAGLDRAEREAVYAVTRTYYTVLYAREQERVAQSTVTELSVIHGVAKDQVAAGARDVTAEDVDRALLYLRLAQAKQAQASQGVKRALAALAEAIGLEPDACLDVPPGGLPRPEVRPCLGDVIAAALARRAEVIQTGIFADVVSLEVEAQGTSIHRRMQTFASAADIHAQQARQGVHDDEYRPGANPEAMPGSLAGCKPARMRTAQAYATRAAAVAEETRYLIVLEARNAFLLWEEASLQVPQAEEAAKAGVRLADAVRRSFIALPGNKVKVADMLTAQVLASQARVQYNDYLFHLIIALADLERITAGAICAGLVGAAPPPAAEQKGDAGK
jgi:outer membrane protein TolC